MLAVADRVVSPLLRQCQTGGQRSFPRALLFKFGQRKGEANLKTRLVQTGGADGQGL